MILFSYLSRDSVPAQAFLDRILRSHGQHQRYELSRLILESCENFVISPDYFDTWSEQKAITVREYFVRTTVESDLGYESPDLYLF